MLGGFLDHYALFRSRRGSYYFSDEGPPDFVGFSATGIEVRFEAHERLDPHFVRHPDSGQYRKVVRLQSRSDFPVYTVQPMDRDSVNLLVEGLGLPIWVIAVPDERIKGSEFEHLNFHIADAIAFWIWQLTPSLQSLVSASTITAASLNAYAVIRDANEWLTGVTDPGEGFGIEVIQVDEASLQFNFSKGFAAQAMLAQNVAERELATLLVAHLSELLGMPTSRSEAELIVDSRFLWE